MWRDGREYAGHAERVLVIGPMRVELHAAEPWSRALDELLSGYRPGAQGRPRLRVAIVLDRATRSHHGQPRQAAWRRDGACWIDSSEMWDANIERAPDGAVWARFALRDDPPPEEATRPFVRKALVAAALKVTLAHVAPWFGGLLLHASALARPDGRGLVFCGPSGEGKTTMPTRLPGWRALSDDAALVYPDGDGGWRAAGTPLAGREGFPRRAEDVPLAGVVHLEKGADRLALAPLAHGEALHTLLARTFYFAPPDAGVLAAATALALAIPSLRLRSSLGHDPVPLLSGVGA